MSRINRGFFFSQVRQYLFSGYLSTAQVAGLEGILNEWEEYHSSDDDRWLAYMLATVHHETDRTFRPIKEYGGESYYRQMYDVTGMRPTLARKNGNLSPGDGARYCGRGFVQLTWKNNYQRLGDICGFDLVSDPDLALTLPVATKILFSGMINGLFTGRCLSDYFSNVKEDWVNARRIINGIDKANLIGQFGRRYYGAISYTTG